MTALHAILTKREVRSYTGQPLPDRVLRDILRAGRASGSSRNRQPWRFVVVRDRERLRQLATLGRFAGHVATAAAAIAVAIETPRDQFDAGRAAQNMMVAAWAAGVGSCPASMHRAEEARRFLGIPEPWTIAVAVAFGYPDPAGQQLISGFPKWAVLTHAGRKRLEELAYAERWGEPLPA